MKSVMLSIKPKYCDLIASGQKTIEIRKTRPKVETPFKCYIYECIGKKLHNDYFDYEGCGKVIGEFVCDHITEYPYEIFNDGEHIMPFGDLEKTCLDGIEIYDYLGIEDGYGWHISDLKIYDKPKKLKEFWHCGVKLGAKVSRPPQSWCYVEEVT